MRTLFILLALVMLTGFIVGCSDTALRSMDRNIHYFGDDVVRFAGLDQPSSLHPRDNVPYDVYMPYKPYE